MSSIIRQKCTYLILAGIMSQSVGVLAVENGQMGEVLYSQVYEQGAVARQQTTSGALEIQQEQTTPMSLTIKDLDLTDQTLASDGIGYSWDAHNGILTLNNIIVEGDIILSEDQDVTIRLQNNNYIGGEIIEKGDRQQVNTLTIESVEGERGYLWIEGGAVALGAMYLAYDNILIQNCEIETNAASFVQLPTYNNMTVKDAKVKGGNIFTHGKVSLDNSTLILETNETKALQTDELLVQNSVIAISGECRQGIWINGGTIQVDPQSRLEIDVAEVAIGAKGKYDQLLPENMIPEGAELVCVSDERYEESDVTIYAPIGAEVKYDMEIEEIIGGLKQGYFTHKIPVQVTVVQEDVVYGTLVAPQIKVSEQGVGETITLYYEGIDGTQYGESTAPKEVGRYKVHVTYERDMYVGTAEHVFEIKPKEILVQAHNYTIKKGEALPQFQVSYTGFVYEDNETLLAQEAKVTCLADGREVGDYPIMFTTQAQLMVEAEGNYTLRHQSGTLSITPNTVTDGENSTGSNTTTTKRETEEDFWKKVAQQIKGAQANEVIIADARAYDKMPIFVVEALWAKDVTLAIKWKGGGDIMIHGQVALLPEEERLAYTLEELYDLYTLEFVDIEGHWAEQHIAYVVVRGILKGQEVDTFAPQAPMTRGMFVTALGRMSGEDMSGYITSSFVDVEDTAYFMPYIEWAYERGIIKGVGEGAFMPGGNITRQEMALMMARYIEGKADITPEEAIHKMEQAGVMEGRGDGELALRETATRAEVAAILRRMP